jgi:RimJ/RimL family protein N-acetyltransferase
MFPDLLRDDVFRLETRRLWLRWPRAADAATIARLAGDREVAEMTSRIPHPYPPGSAAEFVLMSRAANHEGRSLTLVLSPKARPNEALGCIDLAAVGPDELRLGYWLGRPFWSQGLMSEAAIALIDITLRVSEAESIRAAALKANPASRRVLEKCGFVSRGEGVIPAPARGGAMNAEQFWLTRGFVRSAGTSDSAVKKCA